MEASGNGELTMDNGQVAMDNGQLVRHAECPDSSAADRRDVSSLGV
jgi:hypothetical protein